VCDAPTMGNYTLGVTALHAEIAECVFSLPRYLN